MGNKKSKSAFTHQDIMALFSEASKPLSKREIYQALNVPKQQRQEVRAKLKDLVRQGKLIRIGKAYGQVRKMDMVAGILEIQRSGIGFILPEDKRRKDIFISRNNLGGAMHGDKVLAAIMRERRGRNPEGRIVRILERRQEELSATISKKIGKNVFLATPTDPRHGFSLTLDFSDQPQQPSPGEVVLVTELEQLEHNVWSGRVSKLLGPARDVPVQEELVKANHGIPTSFPQQVINQAENLPLNPDPEDFTNREDLRDLPLVTIDGANAKDFDDAVYVEAKGDKFRLWVAIADVSHYVQPGSGLDQEAQERGNSYYFPMSVEPMFPERLSNGLCSLVPDEPRLAMVVRTDFSKDGKPQGSSFFPAVIQSHARLTYSQVRKAVLEDDPQEQSRLQAHMAMLRNAERLARILNRRRRQRGSLDFDLPEPEILINIRDRTEDIRPKVRHFGHQIIEEFMLAANEEVAAFLRERNIPFLYRIHPEPDTEKLDSLFELLRGTSMGSELPEERDTKGIQQLLAAAEDTDMEFLVNRLVLRAMMQAKYAPSNEGHFGLASECYCHFTSPIRRYADLVVHRSLKQVLSQEPQAVSGLKKLKKVADHINTRERLALDAEREVVKRLTILFLEDKVGQEFTGVISSLADFGFWIELNEVMAEGMVRLSTMTDDYYQYYEKSHELVGQRTGRTFKLGQKVSVVLQDVNLSRLEVNLALAE